jgi:ABC-type antimicrobial peptide transport system permease subunit
MVALTAQRLSMRLFQLFSALTLVLAASGLYGLLAYLVHQRRKELNIRAAVGATSVDLAQVVLRESLTMALAGGIVCLVALPVASAWWRALTEGLPDLDAWAWIGTPVALIALAVLASLGPARTAARQVDGAALRED